MVSSQRETSQVLDLDLERRVHTYLLDRGVGALRQIAVHAERGTVTLHGRVSSFYHKQLCLSCCRRVAGVVEVDDRISVS